MAKKMTLSVGEAGGATSVSITFNDSVVTDRGFFAFATRQVGNKLAEELGLLQTHRFFDFEEVMALHGYTKDEEGYFRAKSEAPGSDG